MSVNKTIQALRLLPQPYILHTLFYSHSALQSKTIPNDLFIRDKYPFLSLSKDDDGLSVVLGVPKGHQDEVKTLPGLGGADKAHGPWRGIKIRGPLDFGLTGILNELTTPLRHAQIGIYALSTWDTDYVLVPASKLDDALQVLRKDGWTVTDAITET